MNDSPQKLSIPQSKEAEFNLLSCLIIDPEKISTVADKIAISDFYSDVNARIYQVILDLYKNGQAIEHGIILEKYPKTGQISEADNDYILSLGSTIGSTIFLENYINQIRNTSNKRRLIKVAQEIVKEGHSNELDFDDYFDRSEEKFFELVKLRKTGDFITVGQVGEEVLARLEKIKEANRSGGVTGIDTGLVGLNKIIDGFHEEELVIVAARPGKGKSAFAIQLAINMAQQGKKIAFFSLEMSNEMLTQRILSNVSNIPGNSLRTAQLKPGDWKTLQDSVKYLKNIDILFDDSSVTNVNDIRAKARQRKHQHGLDIVIIDYLQLLGDDGRSRFANRQEEVSKNSRALKQLARELKIPVIALSQLSRAAEQREQKKSGDPKPRLSDLRESGSIEQDADVVLFLYNDEIETTTIKDPETAGDHQPVSLIKLLVGKNRQGQSDVEVFLSFNKSQSLFIEQSDSGIKDAGSND